MSEPHAICRDGEIFWRGSNPTFVHMMPTTARTLLARQALPEPMLADLARAIAQYDAHHSQEIAA